MPISRLDLIELAPGKKHHLDWTHFADFGAYRPLKICLVVNGRFAPRNGLPEQATPTFQREIMYNEAPSRQSYAAI